MHTESGQVNRKCTAYNVIHNCMLCRVLIVSLLSPCALESFKSSHLWKIMYMYFLLMNALTRESSFEEVLDLGKHRKMSVKISFIVVVVVFVFLFVCCCFFSLFFCCCCCFASRLWWQASLLFRYLILYKLLHVSHSTDRLGWKQSHVFAWVNLPLLWLRSSHNLKTFLSTLVYYKLRVDLHQNCSPDDLLWHDCMLIAWILKWSRYHLEP